MKPRVSLLHIRKFLTSLLVSLGALWTIIEICSFFSDKAQGNLKNLWWLFILAAIMYSLVDIWPRSKMSFCLCNRDVTVQAAVSDIWSLDGCLIIPVNNRFLIDAGNTLLKSNTILSQFVKKFYDSKPYVLQNEVNNTLTDSFYSSRRVSSLEYIMGTVVRISAQDKEFYLVCNTILNSHNKAESTREHLETCLSHLWTYLSEAGSKGDFVIPLLGTGRGRIPITRFDVYKEILLTFIASCVVKNYCDKLTICINGIDVKNHSIDIERVFSYTKAKVEHADIRDNTPSVGTNTM